MFTRITGKLILIFSLLALLTPAVSAQNAAIVPGTITVVGEGSASMPAETADIVITIGADYPDYVEPLSISAEGSTIPETVDVSSVLDALIMYSIPVNDVEVVAPIFMGEWGAGMSAQPATILVRVFNPTVDGLTGLLDVVRTSAHADGLYVNQFGVVYGIADCRALRQQARINAVAQATLEAEDQAAALNVPIGKIVASRDTYPMNPVYFPLNSCTVTPEAKGHSTVYMAAQFDPGLPAEVVVVVAVEISFEIP